MWSVKNGQPPTGETGTSAPIVIKDKVMVGNSGGEFGVRAGRTLVECARYREKRPTHTSDLLRVVKR